MLSNEIKRLKMKKIKFENLGKNPEIRHLPTNHPWIPNIIPIYHKKKKILNQKMVSM